MTSIQSASWWRGYVNQITYGLDLRYRVTEADVAWLVDDMIGQRTFTRPVESYYEAATAALESSESITDGDQDEEFVRDFLGRLLHALDERRPWPEPPFYKGDRSEWETLRYAPVIARIALTQMDVENRLNRSFYKLQSSDGEARVLILRLRTGQDVAMVAPPSITEPGINLLANTERGSTIVAFRELTGIDAG